MITVSLTPKNLDSPLEVRSINYTNEFYLLENLTTRLVSLDESGEYKLELAENIKEINELEYVIKIKENYFSNGEKISPEDVKKSLMRTILSGSNHVQLLESVRGIEVEKDSVRVFFKKRSKSFLYYLSLPDMGILHKTQYEKESLKASDFVKVSSGPFSYLVSGQDYYLIKNKYFKLSNVNYPDKVKLIDPFEYNVLDLALNEKLDLGQVSLKQFLEHKKKIMESGLRVLGVPSDMLTYIFFNENSVRFRESSHRKWLRHMIDSHFKISSEYEGIARRTKQYFPPESKAYLNEKEVELILKENEIVKKPDDFPDVVNIFTFTTGFEVSIEPLIRKLESISGVNIKIHNTVSPSDKAKMLKSGEVDIFINMTSTDFRVPAEAINFEFYSRTHELNDRNGEIKKHFENYLNTDSSYEEEKSLQEISREIIRSDQIIPLFHNAIPIIYNSSKINLERVNHLFVLNFWKINTYK